MPRLQILRHKSYHPYLEKNKQRVREDEAKARAEEEEREAARVDAESRARMDALRRKAGSPGLPDNQFNRDANARRDNEDDDNLPSTSSFKQVEGGGLMERHRKAKARAEKEEKRRRDRLDFDFPSETARKEKLRADKDKERERMAGAEGATGSYDYVENGRESQSPWMSGGHLNLFADIERAEEGRGGRLGASSSGMSLDAIAKKANDGPKPDAYTMFLGRPDRETKPWYTDKEMKRAEEKETGEEAEIRRARDRRKEIRSKERHDPLTTVNTLLAKHSNGKAANTTSHRPPPTPKDPGAARLARESSERQRALALIAKRKGGAVGNSWDDTPSSAAGWSERIEREKDRAGHRFFDVPSSHSQPAGKKYGRNWEA